MTHVIAGGQILDDGVDRKLPWVSWRVRDVSRLGARSNKRRRAAPITLKTNASTGSITSPTGPQKFETCPDWGATLFSIS